jgi:hypothetical protein
MIADFYIICMTLIPTEAYSPLIIDSDAVLAESFFREFFQAISR